MLLFKLFNAGSRLQSTALAADNFGLLFFEFSANQLAELSSSKASQGLKKRAA